MPHVQPCGNPFAPHRRPPSQQCRQQRLAPVALPQVRQLRRLRRQSQIRCALPYQPLGILLPVIPPYTLRPAPLPCLDALCLVHQIQQAVAESLLSQIPAASQGILCRLVDVSAVVKRLKAEGSVECVGNALGKHGPRVPVHDGHQIGVAAGHCQIGDIGAPNLIGPVDVEFPEQIRVFAVGCVRDAGPAFGRDDLDA